VHVDGSDREIVVPIVSVDGGESLQRRRHIGEKQRLIFLDRNRGGGVSRKDQRETVSHIGFVHDIGHLFGYINERGGLASLYLQRENVRFEGCVTDFHL
jgi:hypothetical protein